MNLVWSNSKSPLPPFFKGGNRCGGLSHLDPGRSFSGEIAGRRAAGEVNLVWSNSKSPLPPFFKGGNRSGGLSHLAGWTSVLAPQRKRTLQRTVEASSGSKRIPPLKKGGRGDLLLAPPDSHFDESQDRFDYGVRLQQHLSIVESKNVQSHTAQNIGSSSIGSHCRSFKVLTTIHFNHQANSGRKEVDNVIAKRLLSIELHAVQLLSSQSKPEPVFGIRHSQAQASGDRLCSSGICKHACMTAPRPGFRYRQDPLRAVG